MTSTFKKEKEKEHVEDLEDIEDPKKLIWSKEALDILYNLVIESLESDEEKMEFMASDPSQKKKKQPLKVFLEQKFSGSKADQLFLKFKEKLKERDLKQPRTSSKETLFEKIRVSIASSSGVHCIVCMDPNITVHDKETQVCDDCFFKKYSRRYKIPEETVKAIWNSQKPNPNASFPLCFYTNIPLNQRNCQLDHIKSKSTHKHLINDPENLCFVCDFVNSAKGDKSVFNFLELLKTLCDNFNYVETKRKLTKYNQ